MPTTVVILTFSSRINTTSESFKAKNIVIIQQFFYEQEIVYAQLS